MKTIFSVAILGIFIAACATGGGRQAKVTSEPLDEKATIHYDFAFDAFRNGDMIPALTEATKAAELAPKNAAVQNLLGLILFRQSKLAEAERAFQKAGELDPKMSEAFNNLGTLYLAQKRYGEAEQALIRAQDNPFYLYPERIQNNLGLAYVGMNKIKEAETAFRTAMNYRKDFYLPKMHLGRLLLNTQRVTEALEVIQEAAKLCKDCAESQYYLGSAFLKLNKSEEARAAFKRGSDLDPKSDFGRLCQEELAKKD